MTSAPPRSILILSGRYHIISNASLVNNCIQSFTSLSLNNSRMVVFSYKRKYVHEVLLDFSLTVKAETLILISECGSAISSAKEGKSGFIYNLVKS